MEIHTINSKCYSIEELIPREVLELARVCIERLIEEGYEVTFDLDCDAMDAEQASYGLTAKKFSVETL